MKLRVAATGLAAVLVTGLALAQTTIAIDGVAFEEGEVAAYESAVTTRINEVRRIRGKAEEAIRFFDVLDPGLFNAAEKARIVEARTVIRLAAKRQIEVLTATPVTAVSVKRELLERAVAEAEGAEAIATAQAALDAFNAQHPE